MTETHQAWPALRLTTPQRRALELLLLQNLVRTRDDWKTPDGDHVGLPYIAALRRKGLARCYPDRWHARITTRGREVITVSEQLT